MKEQIIDKNKQFENAEEQLRRAQANLAEAKRKQNADKRKTTTSTSWAVCVSNILMTHICI